MKLNFKTLCACLALICGNCFGDRDDLPSSSRKSKSLSNLNQMTESTSNTAELNTIAYHKNQVEQSNAKCNDYETKINELIKEKKQLTTKLGNALKRNDMLLKKTYQMNDTISELNKEIEQEREEYLDNINSMEEKTQAELSKDLKGTELDNDIKINDILLKSMHQMVDIISDLNKQIGQERKKYLDNINSTEEKTQAELSKDLERTELDNVLKRNDILLKGMYQMYDTISDLNEQIEQERKRYLDNIKSMKEKTQAELSKVRKRSADLNEQYQSSDSIEYFQKQMEQNQAQLENYKKIDGFTKEQLQTELRNALNRNDKLLNKIFQVDDVISDLNGQNDNLKKSMQQMKDTISDLNKQIEQLKSEHKKYPNDKRFKGHNRKFK